MRPRARVRIRTRAGRGGGSSTALVLCLWSCGEGRVARTGAAGGELCCSLQRGALKSSSSLPSGVGAVRAHKVGRGGVGRREGGHGDERVYVCACAGAGMRHFRKGGPWDEMDWDGAVVSYHEALAAGGPSLRRWTGVEVACDRHGRNGAGWRTRVSFA